MKMPHPAPAPKGTQDPLGPTAFLSLLPCRYYSVTAVCSAEGLPSGDQGLGPWHLARSLAQHKCPISICTTNDDA